MLAAVAALLVEGCGGRSDQPADSPRPLPDALAGADPGTPQRPPAGSAEMEAWLARSFYEQWSCEVGVSAPRLSGNHGRHRICSNQALLDSSGGPYPVGAASVKQLYTTTDQTNGFAVGVKVQEGEGPNTWYWYERRGALSTAGLLAQGVGVPDCTVCHLTAPRDYVFIRAAAPP